MKIQKIASAALALALSTTMALSAIAEDAKPAAPAAPAAAPAPPAAPAAKPAAKPKTEVSANLTGKLSTKKMKNKKGVEVEGLVLTVATATTLDGKALDGLKGKTLRVMAKKDLNAKSFVGKDVTISGKVVNDRRVTVASIK